MSSDAPWTIKRLLEWTADYLGRQGSASPRLDAEVLLSHCCDCQRIDLYARFDDVPTGDPLERFRAMVKERATGAPVAYLVGHREFYSMSFQVNSDVLIPRPETEFLVIEALDAAKRILDDDKEASLMLVDVGTGSGCIAVSLAKHLPNANVIGIDISPAALEIATKNAEQHGVSEQVEFRTGDVLGGFQGPGQPQIIVSNPPYIGESERSTLMRDVVDFEPELALFAADDGMEIIRRLVDQAAAVLMPGGHLLIEISPVIASQVEQLLASSEAFEFGGMRCDLDNHPRVAKAVRKS